MSLWVFGFYGSVFGGYILYCYASKNYLQLMYMLAKLEAYGVIFHRYILSFFKKSLITNSNYVIPDNVDIKFNEMNDQLTQCRVNNLSETSDTCKFKFMLIEFSFTEFTTEKKITVSLENKDNNFTAYISNNKLDKHFWKWYLETFYNDHVNSSFSRWKGIYSISIMDNKYKHIKIEQDDTIWLKKFGYEIIKSSPKKKVEQKVIVKKRGEQKKRNSFNGEDYSADEDSILTCPNLASSQDISSNPNKYYKMQ